jgi:hypothetical protein
VLFGDGDVEITIGMLALEAHEATRVRVP